MCVQICKRHLLPGSLSTILSVLHRFSFVQCAECHAIFTSVTYLNKHAAAAHPASPLPAPSHSSARRIRDNPHSPSPSAHAATPGHLPAVSEVLKLNSAFLDAYPPHSPELDLVHTNALPAPPTPAAAAVDCILYHCVATLITFPTHDRAATLMIMIPRLLLAPPPSDAVRADLPKLIRTRAAIVRVGRAESLWDAFDWRATLARQALPLGRHPPLPP